VIVQLQKKKQPTFEQSFFLKRNHNIATTKADKVKDGTDIIYTKDSTSSQIPRTPSSRHFDSDAPSRSANSAELSPHDET